MKSMHKMLLTFGVIAALALLYGRGKTVAEITLAASNSTH